MLEKRKEDWFQVLCFVGVTQFHLSVLLSRLNNISKSLQGQWRIEGGFCLLLLFVVLKFPFLSQQNLKKRINDSIVEV